MYCGEMCHGRRIKQKNLSVLRDNVHLSNFNPSLHCKDIDKIIIDHNPGVWVIEMYTGNDSFEIIEGFSVVRF